MKYKNVLAGIFMAAAAAVFAAPAAQADNSTPADPPAAAEAEAPAKPIAVGDFMEKSPEEQMTVVIAVIDNIMAGLKSPYHNGEPKPEDVRQEHLRIAYFINNLFFPKDEDDNVTVNEDALRILFMYFDVYNEQRPDMPAPLVVSQFLRDEYQEHRNQLAASPSPNPDGPG